MKTIRMFSGAEYAITEEELEKIKRMPKGSMLVELRCGEMINLSGIEAIGTPKVWRYKGRPVSKDRSRFLSDGDWISIESPELLELVEDATLENTQRKFNTFKLPEKSNGQKMLEKRSEGSSEYAKLL